MARIALLLLKKVYSGKQGAAGLPGTSATEKGSDLTSYH